ncbi:hypothetical protein [Billgrantia kenyensis]|jgi:hypothetical protein|uniref:Uncharacterized protein n=1 Tax=Billgrantia kenyensis TaxID=321266 RepID=A0A7W0AEQ9_9GAMM|nr:hypothetical protein [Halomonas kenyensis]MBA2780398.1 hypothetical protein [Halomonas kenyensis]MCG6663394.1 hypothetical protein [Halomonas kenyensis]
MIVSLIPSSVSVPQTRHEADIEALLDGLMSDEGLNRHERDELLDLLILERAEIKRQLNSIREKRG